MESIIGKTARHSSAYRGEVGVSGVDVGSKANKELLVCPERGVKSDGADT